MEKSRVHYERKSCMVCTKRFRSGGILIYTGKRPKLNVEWGLCPTHSRYRDRNLIALVEIDPARSDTAEAGETIPAWRVTRTGTVAYLSRLNFHEIFTGEPPETMVAFVTPDVIATLQRLKAGDDHKLH